MSECWTRAQGSVRLGWGQEGARHPRVISQRGVGWQPCLPRQAETLGGGQPRAWEAAGCVFVSRPPRLPPGAGADSPLVLAAVGRAAAGGCWVEASGELTEDADRPRLPPPPSPSQASLWTEGQPWAPGGRPSPGPPSDSPLPWPRATAGSWQEARRARFCRQSHGVGCASPARQGGAGAAAPGRAGTCGGPRGPPPPHAPGLLCLLPTMEKEVT